MLTGNISLTPNDRNDADERPNHPHISLRGDSHLRQHCRKIDIDKSSRSCTVPDPKLTPGATDSSLACVSTTERPRGVTISEKNAILATYGYPVNTKKSSGEFDHWLPHWMGGVDTQENIWFEPLNAASESLRQQHTATSRYG
jgi:hypothetical protein